MFRPLLDLCKDNDTLGESSSRPLFLCKMYDRWDWTD